MAQNAQDEAWSPRGGFIAYSHVENVFGTEESGLYLINSDGTGERLLFPGLVYNLTWSPDGEWIAFYYQRQIFKIKLSGDSLTQLTFDQDFQHLYPRWSPDGKWIAYSVPTFPPGGLWVMSSKDGSQRRQLLENGGLSFWISEDEIGYLFAVTDTTTPRMWAGYMAKFNLNDSTLTILDTIGPLTSHPDYNDRTGKVIFANGKNYDYSLRIYMQDLDGKNEKLVLTNHPAYFPAWLPDGGWIVYTNLDSTEGGLWITDTLGQNQRRLFR